MSQVHPDEDIPQTEDVIPPPLPPALGEAQKMLRAAKRAFPSEVDIANYLNANSRGKFTAAVIRGKVVVAPGLIHPDAVIAHYVDKNPDVLALDTERKPELPMKQSAPVHKGPVPQELDIPKDMVDPSASIRPGSPPRFKQSTVVHGALPERQ